MLEEKLKVKVDIVRAHRLGVYKEGKRRPIVVKLETESDKEKINKAKRDLKGTSIFIDDDYSWRVRQQRLQLIEVAKKERSFGKRATLFFDKLNIDGTKYQWNLEENKLERVFEKSRKN